MPFDLPGIQESELTKQIDEDEKNIQEQIAALQRKVDIAGTVEGLMKHPGFILFKNWIDEQAMAVKVDWSKVTADQMQEIRCKLIVYQDVANWFTKQIHAGKNAEVAIKRFNDETKELSEYKLEE